MANINSTHISDLYPSCTVTNVDSLLVKARESAIKNTWQTNLGVVMHGLGCNDSYLNTLTMAV